MIRKLFLNDEFILALILINAMILFAGGFITNGIEKFVIYIFIIGIFSFYLFNVVKSLLIAPEFSDDFVKDCGMEFEIDLSLITASSLIKILDGFKSSKHNQLPYQLLLKDMLIKEDRILKAISK